MPMSLEETKAAAEAMYDIHEDEVVARQAAYFAAYGEYFQGLQICDPLPSDGNLMTPNFLHQPTDQEATWTPDDFPNDVPASLKIDAYGGDIVGYVSTISFTYNGDLLAKRYGYDGASYMAHDWQIEEV